MDRVPVNYYAFPNISYMMRQIREAFKECERGVIEREALGVILRAMADRIEQRKPEHLQLTLDEVRDHIEQRYGHLKEYREGIKP